MKYLYTYPEKCTGCKLCALACSLKHFNECNPKMGAINIVRDEFDRYEIPFVCLQCDDAECVKVCTKKALKKEGNVVVRDEKRCIRCRMCVVACPYAGVHSFKGKIIKCDTCGGDPLCVKFCSTGALRWEEESREITARRKALAAAILKR
ncbi:MAG: 4Fe-4S dicluster domain-containing protein [Thermoplasmatota archaeon]